MGLPATATEKPPSKETRISAPTAVSPIATSSRVAVETDNGFAERPVVSAMPGPPSAPTERFHRRSQIYKPAPAPVASRELGRILLTGALPDSVKKLGEQRAGGLRTRL